MGRCTILSCTVSDDSAPTTWESGAWSQNSPSSLDCGGYPPSGSEYSSNNRKYVLRVGCAFMAKKMETMQSIIKPRTKDTHRSSKEATAAPTHGGVIAVDDMSVLFQTIQLDDDVPLEAQGRFDVILHKLSEDVFNRYESVCVVTSLSLGGGEAALLYYYILLIMSLSSLTLTSHT